MRTNSQIKLLPLLFLTFLLTMGCNKKSKKEFLQKKKIEKQKLNKEYLGKWYPLSNNYIATSGDMLIKENEIFFFINGTVNFEILRQNKTECILKINKEVNGGNFMRIAPVLKGKGESTQVEIAFFNSKEKALSLKTTKVNYAESWGIYFRDKN